MTLQEFHHELGQLLYIEDKNMVNVILASIVANSLQIGDPVWLTLIGPSSGGKSQLIRPFAMAHPKFIHRVDDLTPNTLLSGTMGLEGSLLGRIGKVGVLSMDDLTVLFSKNVEARAEILSQFRMLYDGRFSKSTGNRADAITWEGYLGMISGSTPAIYRYFGEVADMGERFISYRMKSIDVHKAVQFVTNHQHTSKELNARLTELVASFLPGLLQGIPQERKYLPKLHPTSQAVIQEAAEHFTLLRTSVHLDDRSGMVDEFPEPEMPFRVMKQLSYLAIGLQCLCDDIHAELPEDMQTALKWTAYSLANDKRRAYLRSLVSLDRHGQLLTARNVSAATGLHVDVVKKGLDQLQALQIIGLESEESGVYKWYIKNRAMAKLVWELDPVTIGSDVIEDI